MTTDKNINFIKLWRKIEKDQQELDFRKSEWARDLRRECKSDDEFTRWCADQIGMVHAQAEELLRRAKLVTIVADAPTWNRLGGYEKLQPLISKDLPRKEQVAIVEAAKVSGYVDRPIMRVMQQRGHIAPPVAPRSTAHLPVIATPTAHEIQRLARFIDETYKNPPPDIRRIVSKYVADKAETAAAATTAVRA